MGEHGEFRATGIRMRGGGGEGGGADWKDVAEVIHDREEFRARMKE